MHYRMNANNQPGMQFGSPYPFVDEYKRSSVTPYSATGDATSFVSKEDMLSKLNKYKKKDHPFITGLSCLIELGIIIFIFTSFSMLIKENKDMKGRLTKLEDILNSTNTTSII